MNFPKKTLELTETQVFLLNLNIIIAFNIIFQYRSLQKYVINKNMSMLYNVILILMSCHQIKF